MRNILLIALSVFSAVATPCASFASEAWFECQSGADCVQVGSGCFLAAVNRTFQDVADKYYKEQNTRMDCAAPIDHAVHMHPVCLAGKDACKMPDGSDDPASTCTVQACALVSDK